jgi:hypothetical protein
MRQDGSTIQKTKAFIQISLTSIKLREESGGGIDFLLRFIKVRLHR